MMFRKNRMIWWAEIKSSLWETSIAAFGIIEFLIKFCYMMEFCRLEQTEGKARSNHSIRGKGRSDRAVGKANVMTKQAETSGGVTKVPVLLGGAPERPPPGFHVLPWHLLPKRIN